MKRIYGILCLYVIVSFLIVSLISLIGCEKLNPNNDRSANTENTISKEYDLRERCGTYCIDYFHKGYWDKVKDRSDNYTTHSDYVSHYNKIKNRCYMLVKSQNIPKKEIVPGITTEYIIDVYENRTFGEITISNRENISYDQKNKGIQEFTISSKENIVSECKVSDDKCKSKEEWDKLVKPYMDEESNTLIKTNIYNLLSNGLPQK